MLNQLVIEDTSTSVAVQQLKAYVSEQIIGQQKLVERLLIALLTDGHLLVEGAPGLAKTRAIKVLSQGIEGDFQKDTLGVRFFGAPSS